jgi:hypothetical protein
MSSVRLVLGDRSSRGIVHARALPVNFLPGGFLPVNFLPGGFLPVNFLPGGILPMSFLPGGFLPVASSSMVDEDPLKRKS